MRYFNAQLPTSQLRSSNISLCRFPSIDNIDYIDDLSLKREKRFARVVSDDQNFTCANVIFPPNMKIYKEDSGPVEREKDVKLLNEVKKKKRLIESFERRRENRLNKTKDRELIEPPKERESQNVSTMSICKTRKKEENENNELSIQDDNSSCDTCPFCLEEKVLKTKKLVKKVKILKSNK